MWLFIALSLMAIVLTIRYGFYESGESEHDQCLKNIGRLEMELFPDLPEELRWATWPTPEAFWYGTRHGVQSNYTQIFPQYNLASLGRSSTRLIAPELDENESLVFSHTMEALTRCQDQWHPVGELH